MAQHSSVHLAPYAPTKYVSQNNGVEMADAKHPLTSSATGYSSDPDLSGRKRQERAGGHMKGIHYKKTYLFANFWVYEVACCIIALALHLATFWLIHHYNGREVAAFHNHWSLNSEVAILVTITKATALIPVAACLGQLKWHRFWGYQRLSDMEAFDEASRGTLGSARLLIHLKFWHFASFGALVTVAALIMDTLAQNVINVEYKLHPMWDNATVPRTNTYDSSFIYSEDGSDALPTADMIGSMNFGVSYTSSVLPRLPPFLVGCSTGNCTYLQYQTLEVNGNCTDITTQLDTSDDTLITLPEGLSLQKNGGIMNTSVSSEYSSNKNFDWDQEVGPLIANWQVIFADPKNNGNLTAVQCVLFWTVATYPNTTVANGFLDNTFSTPFTNTSAAAKTTYGQKEPIIIRPEPCYVNGTTRDSATDPDCLYQVEPEAQRALQNFLLGDAGLTGYAIEIEGEGADNTTLEVSTFFVNAQLQAMGGQYGYPYETFFITGFFLAGMMNRNMPLRLPNNMAPGDARLSGHGTEFRYESFFQMRYAYLTLNHFVVAGSIVFFAITVVMCRKDEVLKTSVLPFLYHGFPAQDRQLMDENPRQADMKYAAEETLVKFGMTPEGKRLGTQEVFGPGV